jgi:hypothetical protein
MPSCARDSAFVTSQESPTPPSQHDATPPWQSKHGTTDPCAPMSADPQQVAAVLIGRISEAQRQAWASGTPEGWSMEAFKLFEANVVLIEDKAPAPS